MSNVCPHGHLARVCEICERDRQISELQARLAAADQAVEVLQRDVYNLTEKVIPNIREKAAAAEKDAERYRWLRLHLSDDSGVNTKEGWMPIAYEGPEGTDAAIDAARGKP